MIYLKTYFYTEHELKFLKLNLLEAFEHIDKFIICEFNRTHTGEPREFIFQNYPDLFTEEEKSKILYFACDISEESRYAKNDENLIHQINEPVMRGNFVKKVSLNDDDIIFSVDADEIIYGHMYPEIIEYVKAKGVTCLTLNQFFYKMNYLWENTTFKAPTVARYQDFKNHYPSQWRYEGVDFPKIVGCHFSWCMTPEQMIYKLNTYSHPKYRFCADLDLLTNAIHNKTYPFDTSVDFQIRELSWSDPLLPGNLNKIL